MATKQVDKMSPDDEAWGFRFGCEGTMRAPEAQKFLGVATSTLRRLVEANRIRRRTLPGRGPRGIPVFCRKSIGLLLAGLGD